MVVMITIKEDRGCSCRLDEKPRERETIVVMMLAEAKKGKEK